MKVALHSSLDFKKDIISVKEYLESHNIDVILPDLRGYKRIRDELGDDKTFSKIKTHLTRQIMLNVERCDCLLILNYNHRGYQNYVGGTSFVEMVVAFYLGKPIFLLHEIPKKMVYTEEIKALEPIVVGSLDRFVEMLRSAEKEK